MRRQSAVFFFDIIADMDYSAFYHRLTSEVRRDERKQEILILFNMYFTYAMYLLYPVLLVWALFTDSRVFAKILFIPAVSFFLLTFVRKIINRPRPYEAYKLDVFFDKQTKGCSMPSRHVFSAVVIAMCLMCFAKIPAYILLVCSMVSCAVRVMLGVHYPSDVIIGYLCGLAAGALVNIL